MLVATSVAENRPLRNRNRSGEPPSSANRNLQVEAHSARPGQGATGALSGGQRWSRGQRLSQAENFRLYGKKRTARNCAFGTRWTPAAPSLLETCTATGDSGAGNAYRSAKRCLHLPHSWSGALSRRPSFCPLRRRRRRPFEQPDSLFISSSRYPQGSWDLRGGDAATATIPVAVGAAAVKTWKSGREP